MAAGLLSAESAASQRVSFRTDDGVVLSATWYEPASRGPAVILLHMLHRSRRDFDALAARLAGEGIGALALDLRGHGDSQGSIGPDFAPMVADVRAARRFLTARSDVNGRIGLLGASLGANLAALEAADDPGVASLALLSPSLDYRGLRIETAMRKIRSAPGAHGGQRRRSVRVALGAGSREGHTRPRGPESHRRRSRVDDAREGGVVDGLAGGLVSPHAAMILG